MTSLGTPVSDQPHDAPPPVAAVPTGSRRTWKLRLRILLAEDNLINRRLAMALLRKQGHQVVVVGNGREALARLGRLAVRRRADGRADAEMDGFETTAAIRAARRTGIHTPIIAVTAHALKGDRDRCLAAGMDAYLSKPLRMEDLFEVLEGLRRLPSTLTLQPLGLVPGPERKLKRMWNLEPSTWRRPWNGWTGTRRLLKELAGLFLDEAPQRMAEIRQAITVRDAESLQRTAITSKDRWAISGRPRPSTRSGGWNGSDSRRTGGKRRKPGRCWSRPLVVWMRLSPNSARKRCRDDGNRRIEGIVWF